MAKFVSLDTAATELGKSEVALRRLVKAGKVPFKEVTGAQGVSYQLDLNQVKAYYAERDANVEAATTAATPVKSQPEVAVHVSQLKTEKAVPIRVNSTPPVVIDAAIVATLEAKYQQEVEAHKATKQELERLRKSNEMQQPAATETESTPSNGVVTGVLSAVVLLLIVAAAYLFFAQ